MDNITIIKHVNNENIYIFCLSGSYLYIYDDKTKKIYFNKMTDLVDKENLNYKYYNIIPYNTDNNGLNFIISSIKVERIFQWYNLYNIYLDFNINTSIFSYNKKWTNSFSVPNNLFKKKNICHILDSSFIIKCIY